MTTTSHIEAPNESRTSAFFFGSSRAIRPVNDVASEIALTDIPVMIVGESGTGKDAYARLMHGSSSRSEGPFAKFNCALFDAAHLSQQLYPLQTSPATTRLKGTLYLDNVHELDLAAQRALLSLLPEESETPELARADMRLISSTSTDLDSEVETGRFRKELYFRLNGACLRLPALRERSEDIVTLLEFFLAKHSQLLRKRTPTVTPEFVGALACHRWPGNVRELENLARKIVVFGNCQGAVEELEDSRSARPVVAVVTSKIVPLKVAARAASVKAERELILQALERTHWNRKRAARELQISYKSLLYKIKQIGVSDEEGKI